MEASALPVKFTGKWTENDFIRMFRCHARVTMRPSIRWAAWLFIALFVVLLVWFMAVKGFDTIAALFTAFCCYLLVGMPLERDWMARRRYRKRNDQIMETTVAFYCDHFSLQSAVNDAKYPWAWVGLVADDRAGVMVCDRDRVPLVWLPSRLFDGNDLKPQLLQLARSAGVLVRKV